ncbi:sensor histidine kinase [Murdochiella massiliensis]|uniref:sensor histidine kinase n=1 Tax=Murdochiella massiliensis TaxID=1673723 RepID=UPI0008373AF2|nr:HAMP domain-containing sensor histidine kinase [Murdochiella massiliensis]
MKRNIWRHFLGAGMIFAGISSLICVGLLQVILPKSNVGQRIPLIIGVVVVLLITALALSAIFTQRIYNESLCPLRILVRYWKDLLSGKDTDGLPAQEAEEMLASLLDTEEERKNFFQQLANVRENETMRRQFSANVSHELKSPLTSINGYAELIASGMVNPEDTRRFADIIHREGVRLLNMINEIIQLSQFDTGYSDFDQREEVDLHEVLREEMTSLSSMAEERHVRLESDVVGEGESDRVVLFGNRRLLADVLRNLLSNAIKYSKPNGGYVLTKLRQDEHNVSIIVEDDGIGIAPEYQKRVFERFFTVDPGRTRRDGSGTGLGLSLVKHIVQAHEGILRLDSEWGKGSRFSILLPRDAQETASVTTETSSQEKDN